jgi:predicted metal-dependent hydrolase
VDDAGTVVDATPAGASPAVPSDLLASVPGVEELRPVPAVEVRRSARRRRTVSAYRDGDRVVVLIPARFSAAQEREWVRRMVDRVLAGERRRRRTGDAELARRGRELSARYLDGRARPASVRWVPAMRTRWASCTPAEGTIRLSRALQDMPAWVQDYVLLHELAHLLEPGHGPRFWRLVERYPRTERARGYLDGVSAAASLPIGDDLGDELDPEPGDDRAAEVG